VTPGIRIPLFILILSWPRWYPYIGFTVIRYDSNMIILCQWIAGTYRGSRSRRRLLFLVVPNQNGIERQLHVSSLLRQLEHSDPVCL
jgi:hypothetical protein